jgi:hypothetical protein
MISDICDTTYRKEKLDVKICFAFMELDSLPDSLCPSRLGCGIDVGWAVDWERLGAIWPDSVTSCSYFNIYSYLYNTHSALLIQLNFIQFGN